MFTKGVEADLSKIAAMIHRSTPRNLKKLRGFLGLTRNNRSFVSSYGAISWPLRQQLKKDTFGWMPEVELAF